VAGRLAQPEKNPDSMDIVLQGLGGIVGFVMMRIFFSHKTLPRYSGGASLSPGESQHTHKIRREKSSGIS